AEAAYADGLRRDLASGLGSVARGITVVEVAPPAGAASTPLRELTQRAGVRYVVEGDVRAQPQGQAVDLRLVDSASGGQAWTTQSVLTGADGSTERAIERRTLLRQLVNGIQKIETRRVLPLPIESLSASELVLRAWAAQEANSTLAGNLEAERYLDRALIL